MAKTCGAFPNQETRFTSFTFAPETITQHANG